MVLVFCASNYAAFTYLKKIEFAGGTDMLLATIMLPYAMPIRKKRLPRKMKKKCLGSVVRMSTVNAQKSVYLLPFTVCVYPGSIKNFNSKY